MVEDERGHTAAPPDQTLLLTSPLCPRFRPLSTTTSPSPSQMNWCRRKQRGRRTRWTQRPPLMCSGKSKTSVTAMDTFISRTVEQSKLKSVCNANICDFCMQVCVGAVQRSLVADMYSCHARPSVLPACPPGCSGPNVQCHPEHALAVQGEKKIGRGVPAVLIFGQQGAAELLCRLQMWILRGK